ncbi:MAG: hypothetical protein A2X99_01705 [Deltaproteobacteria bacterium GWB2_55_19]|nr:MAG: hypothetical protein A2X99_01705 [Deltaproteobacteria bacterium GWB2_55_19]
MTDKPSSRRPKLRYASLLSAIVLIASGALAFSAPPGNGLLLIDDFSAETPEAPPAGWNKLLLPRKKKETRYTVVKDGENKILKAESSSSASAVYKEFKGDEIRDFEILSWRWKVEGILKKGDETRKDGDDYSARIYVTFEYEPEKTSSFDKFKFKLLDAFYGIKAPGNAVNYIWANKLKKGEAVKNPFTDRVVMVAVESGAELTGQWLNEERNIYEDYKKFFKDTPPRITGVVIMTDTDNTNENATGYYDDIALKKKP